MTKTNGFGTLAATKQITTQDDHADLPHSEANLLERATQECPMVERAQAGDRQALETLLAAARPRLLSVALKMLRDPDDAEDVVQDAMMKVWRYVGRFEGRAALSTWLHRIVVNTALDHLRSKRVGPVAARAMGGEDTDGEERRGPEAIDEHTPEVALGSAEVGVAVRQAMATLSPVHHQVLALRGHRQHCEVPGGHGDVAPAPRASPPGRDAAVDRPRVVAAGRVATRNGRGRGRRGPVRAGAGAPARPGKRRGSAGSSGAGPPGPC
jgi:RNA polymerase sigma-70 factor (ECF subfamily)